MHRSTELVEISKNRVYIEPDPEIVPGVTHMGRLDFSSASHPLEPHTHGGAVEFCYLERGVAVFQAENRQWRLMGGECFVSYPDEIHGTGSHPLERMKLFWIGYRPEKVSGWLTLGCGTAEQRRFEKAVGSALPRVFRGSKRMGAAVSRAIDSYIGNSAYRTIEIKSALLDLLLYLADKKSREISISPEIQQVIELIDNRVNSPDSPVPSLAECAVAAGISLSRFKARFKAETGIPPAEFITRSRIERASGLLLKGTPVLDTALECGFSSSQYFATVFRRYRNASPSEWLESAGNFHS